MAIELIAFTLFLLSLVGCCYFAVATLVVLAFPRRLLGGGRAQAEPVTVLKPLCGLEPGLYERLRSFCDQDYPAPVQIVLGVQRADDPALGPARRLARDWPARVQVVTNPGVVGANPKVSNLVNMTKAARHDVLVMSDSDIEVEPDYLAQLVGHLQSDGVGAVTCLYHGVARSGLWSRFGALAIDGYFLPNVVTALALGLAQPCFGSTIAIRRETLAAIGGLEAYANQLADDYAIGMAVRRLGLKVAVPGFTVGHLCSDRSFLEMCQHELRWARTIRTIDPAGYAGTVIAHPFALALIGTALDSSRGFWLVFLAFTCRLALCVATQHRFALTPQSSCLLPLRDILHFAVFVTSFTGRSARWRDHDYDVAEDGVIRAEEATQ